MRCIIPLKGGQKRIVNLPTKTLKVERENAWAMTRGYRRRSDNKWYYVSIFTAGERAVSLQDDFDKRSGYVPKILSYRKHPEPRFPVSQDGADMGHSNYKQSFPLPHRYVAILNSIFYVDKEFHTNRGEKDIWGVLCNNGVFDIWEPVAPYNRLTGLFDEGTRKKEIMKPQILLLRVFELDRALMVEDGLKRPIIPYDRDDKSLHAFQGTYTIEDTGNRIGDHLRETLDPIHVPWEEVLVNDTSQIEIPV
jgi:hypothetical protein